MKTCKANSPFSWLAIGLLMLLGCIASSEKHAEHHDPPHRPADFVAAVERLQSIQGAASVGDMIPSIHPAGDIQQETADLLNWLPELAAESDLSRADWNELYLSTELIRRNSAKWNSKASASPDLSKQLESVLPVLERCASSIRSQSLALQPAAPKEATAQQGDEQI